MTPKTEIEKEISSFKKKIKSALTDFRNNTGLGNVSVSSIVTLTPISNGEKIITRDDITIHINE